MEILYLIGAVVILFAFTDVDWLNPYEIERREQLKKLTEEEGM